MQTEENQTPAATETPVITPEQTPIETPVITPETTEENPQAAEVNPEPTPVQPQAGDIVKYKLNAAEAGQVNQAIGSTITVKIKEENADGSLNLAGEIIPGSPYNFVNKSLGTTPGTWH